MCLEFNHYSFFSKVSGLAGTDQNPTSMHQFLAALINNLYYMKPAEVSQAKNENY